MAKLSPIWTKNGHFWSEITKLFCKNFASFSRVLESTDITKIVPKFEKRQFPKLAKTKNLEKKTSNAGPYTPAASRNNAQFKSGPKRLEKYNLALLVKICDTPCICFVLPKKLC